MKPPAAALLLLFAACGHPCDDKRLSADAQAGCRVYHASCVKCHNLDPRQDGMLGPPVAGSSLELLEHKIVKKTYPPGYVPKRPGSDQMRIEPLDHVVPQLPALAAYLQEVTRLQ